jgi:hypothetical protein
LADHYTINESLYLTYEVLLGGQAPYSIMLCFCILLLCVCVKNVEGKKVINAEIYVSDSGSGESCSYSNPCSKTISTILQGYSSPQIKLRNSYSSNENLTIEKDCDILVSGNNRKEFKINNNFQMKVFSVVSIKKINFIVSSGHIRDENNFGENVQVFAVAIKGNKIGKFVFEDCEINATDTTTKIQSRLFTINSSLTLKNVIIKNMAFDLKGLGEYDPLSPIYILTQEKVYFENLNIINITKSSEHEIISHRRNGSDYKNCTFENTNHSAGVISFWYIFILNCNLFINIDF